ncbi:hypothetical protein ACIPXV_09755 [Streptomyces libani]|uniref:hypothetical protein n=1 Tax=Streptomyces nigrescens TaxID=1920 RepID=UPI00380E4367
MTTPDKMRARATELESRARPLLAGPRTDDERMWLEKAAALRAEADRLEGETEKPANTVDQGLSNLFLRLDQPTSDATK